MLAKGTSGSVEPAASSAPSADARMQLEQALERGQRLLGRRSAARRSELAEALQQLADAVTAALTPPADDARPADSAK